MLLGQRLLTVGDLHRQPSRVYLGNIQLLFEFQHKTVELAVVAVMFVVSRGLQVTQIL